MDTIGAFLCKGNLLHDQENKKWHDCAGSISQRCAHQMKASRQGTRSLASDGAAIEMVLSPCYGLRVPFRLIQPPLKNRWRTMLWPSRKKAITNAATNATLPIANQIDFCFTESVEFVPLVIRMGHPPNTCPAMDNESSDPSRHLHESITSAPPKYRVHSLAEMFPLSYFNGTPRPI